MIHKFKENTFRVQCGAEPLEHPNYRPGGVRWLNVRHDWKYVDCELCLTRHPSRKAVRSHLCRRCMSHPRKGRESYCQPCINRHNREKRAEKWALLGLPPLDRWGNPRGPARPKPEPKIHWTVAGAIACHQVAKAEVLRTAEIKEANCQKCQLKFQKGEF